VREHPNWFRTIERDVTLADIERAAKLEELDASENRPPSD
jgi:hypothetical protein